MTAPACPRIVLLVEDEDIIGLTLEDDLTAAGYDVVGPFTPCASALGWLRSGEPHLAVLDVSLRDGHCVDLARQLRRRGIPFVVYSGTSQAQASPEFRDAPWLGKPAPVENLVLALRGLLAPIARTG